MNTSRFVSWAFLLTLPCASGCGEKPASVASNSIFILVPYRHGGTWVFDDESRNLRKEPFVIGIPGMIDKLVENVPGADKGFRLLFSAQPFPGHTHTLVWKRAEGGGNWYECPQLTAEGWLCPALRKFFLGAPRTLYFKAEAM